MRVNEEDDGGEEERSVRRGMIVWEGKKAAGGQRGTGRSTGNSLRKLDHYCQYIDITVSICHTPVKTHFCKQWNTHLNKIHISIKHTCKLIIHLKN